MESDSSSNSAAVWATVSQQQQGQQPQQIQVQPSTAQQQQQQVQPAQFVAATPSSSGNFTVTTSQQQALPILTTSQPTASASGSATFSAQYVDFRHPQFTTYHINIPQAELYQPAQSNYERISPADEFRTGEVVPGNEAIATYSALRTADGTQLIAAPTVDSTTLHAQGIQVHHVMLEDQLLTVQRVMSPVDCTVSQSTLSHHHDQDHHHEAAIITGSHPHQQQRIEAMSASGEPDTTQEDSQDFNIVQVGSGVTFSSDGDIGDTTDANGLHSTMPGCSSSSSNRISTTTQDVLLHVTPGPSVNRAAQLSSSTVDSVMASDVAVSAAGAILHTIGPSQTFRMDSTRQQEQQQQQQQRQQQPSLESISVVDSSGAVDHEIQNDPHVVLVNGLDLEAESSSCTSPGSSNSASSMDAEKENVPQSSRQLRKSNRIANLEIESIWSNRHKRHYHPKEYNPNELWCEECMTTYTGECPEHRLQIVPDKIVLSRAWSSLPSILQIFRLGESTELGVFAKRYIPKSTQFGPLIGEPVASQSLLADSKFILMMERENNDCYYFKTSDENKCNWMMFVRPAEKFAEQNLVAYQHGQDIFFTVSKNIEPKQELKVWYACNYAERIGAQVLDITDEDIEVLNEQECDWPCYECNKRFKTSAALQKHLLVHEETFSQQEDGFDAHDELSNRRNKKTNFSSTPGSSPMRKTKRHHRIANANGEMSGYQWKKKTSTFYLNKTLKKYHRRHDHEALRRRTLKSLYRKKGKETGGNEWVCTHCDLTFDNSNLLNLHTLTHAAEDVGLDEVKRLACDPNENKVTVTTALQLQKMVSFDANGIMKLEDVGTILTLDDDNLLACPVCCESFPNQHDLIEHASVHGKTRRKLVLNPDRPHKCEKCWKAFGSHERLQKHLLCHGDENTKPLQCQVCCKRFMNNSALSCHMKTHSDRKYYECPLCRSDFDQVTLLKSHVTQHEQPDGKYRCPICKREFEDFATIRKHMRAFHSDKKYPCPQCEKIFPRPDKLKLHMLRHSSHREFMCENCGRQFKRKDKLKEHIKRMHSAEREARLASKDEKPVNYKSLPKVSPNDYHRFIYKCHTCLLGFKRRGMLVNHLAKRHPDIKPETVPELNLPILKTQRDYYCQYCEKVYKSSSKRKAHILKNHPGSELPMSSRRRSNVQEMPGIPNPTYSQMVGSITTMPHSCSFCHKQYASKAKLMQHQRKKHSEMMSIPSIARRVKEERLAAGMSDDSQGGVGDEDYDDQPQAVADSYQQADLLTQAMSELTQSLEYRPTGDYTVTRVTNTPTPNGQPTMVQIQATPLAAVPGQHTTTIELSHLGQNLVHAQFAAVNQPQGEAIVATANPESSQSLSPSQQTINTQAATVPVTLSGNTITLARTWTNFNFR